jgi:hypothetical protein
MLQFSEAKNQPITEVEEVLAKLLDLANTDVRISTGLSTGIFQHEKPKEALIRCLHRLPKGSGAPMKVLLDGEKAERRASDYSWWLDAPGVECHVAENHAPHMLIVDGQTFRLEDPHDEKAEVRSNSLVLHAPEVAAKPIVLYFDSLFKTGRPRSAIALPHS